MSHYGVEGIRPPDADSLDILKQALTDHPKDLTVLTLGPLHNIGWLLQETDLGIERCVSMAGYWGGPGQPRSEKEYNLNGCGWAARAYVESDDRFGRRLMVGKNCTHQVKYDADFHETFRKSGDDNPAHRMIHELMSFSRSLEKKLHDPLAAAVAVNEEGVVSWSAEVRPEKHEGQWGCVEEPGSRIRAATSVDLVAFRREFTRVA